MTIDTQSAAPQGAAPASVAAVPAARPGDAPASQDSFASLVAQLSGGAPAERPRTARAAIPAAAPADGPPFSTRSARAGASPASNGDTSVPASETASGSSKADETGSALIDPTTIVPSAAADPSTAVPAWLWAISAPGAPPAADAGQTDDDRGDPQSFSTAGPQTLDDALAPVAAGGSDWRGAPSGTGRTQPGAGYDAAVRAGSHAFGLPADLGGASNTPHSGTTILAGESIDAGVASETAGTDLTDAPVLARSVSRAVDLAYTRRGAALIEALSGDADGGASDRAAHSVDADAAPGRAAPDRVGSATPADGIALDRASRSGTPLKPTMPAATPTHESTRQPAPLADGVSYTPARTLSADATSAAAAPDWLGSARGVDRTAPASDAALRPALTVNADAFSSTGSVDHIALGRASRTVTRFSAPFGAPPPATPASGSTGEPAPLPAGTVHMLTQTVDGATSAQPVEPNRFAPARFLDRIALDRANRSGTRFTTTVTNERPGQPGPLAASDTYVAASDPASAFDSHESPSGESLSDRASRDEARMLADRATGAASFRIEHGGMAAVRPVEVVGAGALQTTTAAPVHIPASADAPIAIPDERDLRHQIIQGIKFQWRDGVGDVKLTLHPEYLGEMNIALRVDQSGVTAQLSTDSASVRAWALANESLLRQGLSEQGLTLSRLVVTDEAPESSPDRESRRRQPQQETPEPPAPRRSDSATFEIVL